MASSSSSSSSFPLGPHTLPTPRLTLRTPTADLLPALAAYWPGQTPEALASKIQKWDQTRAEGVNAWLVVVLNNDDDDEDGGGDTREKDTKVIGFGGYNSLPRTSRPSIHSAEEAGLDQIPVDGAEDKVLVADMGIEIDARYQRKGYAREAICAMTEYAFGTLGCGAVHLDTPPDNAAFRAVMRDMGLPERPGSGKEEDAGAPVFAFAWKSINYDFDEAVWEAVRQDLKRRGKWPLVVMQNVKTGWS